MNYPITHADMTELYFYVDEPVKDEDLYIKKGDAIGQAMFIKYLTTDQDAATGIRKGGFGSTSEQ